MSTKKSDYDRDYADWKRTLPYAPHHVLHAKAMAHAKWRERAAETAEAERVKAQTIKHEHEHRHVFPKWAWYVLGFLLAVAIVPRAHCQFSHIDYIDIQNQGTDIGFFTFPFKVNFTGAGVSCSNSSGTVTCTVTGGSITNNPGGSNTNVQYNNSGSFGGIAEAHLGAVLIDQGPGVVPAFADPLVQGTQAAGSTTATNPVSVGGYDTSGTPVLRTETLLNGTPAGTEYAFVTRNIPSGTQAVSVASLPLPSGGSTSANQCGASTGALCFVQPSDGTHSMPMGDASARSIHVTPDSLPSIPSGANTIGTVNLGTTPDPCGPGQAKSYQFYDASTNGATQLVGLVSGKVIYVCSYTLTSSSTTANTLKLVYGTGSNCATGQTAMTPGFILQAISSAGPAGKVNPNSAGLQTAASNELCLLTNAAQAAQAEVSYVQQ